jgi:O-antigen biosynthesis protein
MRLSVAIPCYNGAVFLAKTIESILAQTHAADELLVIDDGSSDASVEISKRYPVQLIQHSQNRGLAEARNTALTAAVGDILVFVDVDAWADPTLLAVLVTGYKSESIGGVGGQGIESHIRTVADRWRRLHATQGHGPRQKDVDYLYGLCMSYRKTVLQAVGGFNPTFSTNAEDVDVGLRIRAAGYRLRYTPEAKVYHQRQDSEATLKRAMTMWYAAGYQARLINGASAWRMFARTVWRQFADPFTDLVQERDWQLARLSWQIGWLKLQALRRKFIRGNS